MMYMYNNIKVLFRDFLLEKYLLSSMNFPITEYELSDLYKKEQFILYLSGFLPNILCVGVDGVDGVDDDDGLEKKNK